MEQPDGYAGQVRRLGSMSRTVYVTCISVRPALQPSYPAPHPLAGRLGLDETRRKERLVGDDALFHISAHVFEPMYILASSPV